MKTYYFKCLVGIGLSVAMTMGTHAKAEKIALGDTPPVESPCTNWQDMIDIKEITSVLLHDNPRYPVIWAQSQNLPLECAASAFEFVIMQKLQQDGTDLSMEDQQLIDRACLALGDIGLPQSAETLWYVMKKMNSLRWVRYAYFKVDRVRNLSRLKEIVTNRDVFSYADRIDMYYRLLPIAFSSDGNESSKTLYFLQWAASLEDNSMGAAWIDAILGARFPGYYQESIQRKELADRLAEDPHPSYDYFRRIKAGLEAYPPAEFKDLTIQYPPEEEFH